MTSVNHVIPEDIDTLLSRDSRYFTLIPDEHVKQSHVYIYLNGEDVWLHAIPDRYINKNVVKYFMEKHPWKLSDIPEDYITKDIIDLLDDNHIRECYSSIPVKFKTPRMTILYAENNEYIDLQHIPPTHITQDMVDRYVKQYNLFIPYYIPDKFITREIIEQYIFRLGWKLSGIRNIDKKLVKRYTNKKHWDLEEIPPTFMTEKIIKKYVQLPTANFNLVDDKYLTKELVINSIKSGNKVANISEKYMTEDVMKLFIEIDPNNLRLFPKHLVSREFFISNCDKMGAVLEDIPEKFMTGRLLLYFMTRPFNLDTLLPYAIKYAGNEIDRIPDISCILEDKHLIDEFKNEYKKTCEYYDSKYGKEKSKDIIKQKWTNLIETATLNSYLEENKTWDVLRIPRHLLSDDIIKQYVVLNHARIENVPPIFITPKILFMFIKSGNQSSYIPFEFRKKIERLGFIQQRCCRCSTVASMSAEHKKCVELKSKDEICVDCFTIDLIQ